MIIFMVYFDLQDSKSEFPPQNRRKYAKYHPCPPLSTLIPHTLHSNRPPTVSNGFTGPPALDGQCVKSGVSSKSESHCFNHISTVSPAWSTNYANSDIFVMISPPRRQQCGIFSIHTAKDWMKTMVKLSRLRAAAAAECQQACESRQCFLRRSWDGTRFQELHFLTRLSSSVEVVTVSKFWCFSYTGRVKSLPHQLSRKKQQQRFFVCGGCVLTTTMIIVSFWQSLKSSEVQCYTKSSKILLQRMSLWEILLEHRWWRYNGATTMIIIIIWK